MFLRNLIGCLALALFGCDGGPIATIIDAGVDGDRSNATVDATLDTSDEPRGDAAFEAGLPRPRYATELPTFAHYESVADEAARVKFTIAATGRDPFLPHACVFPDSLRYPYHLPFLRENFPDLASLDLPTYASWILNRSSRRMWGGEVSYKSQLTHPSNAHQGVFGYRVYQELQEGEDLTDQELLDAQNRLLQCAPSVASALVFVPYGRQVTWATARRDALSALGIAVMLPADFGE